MSGRVDDGTVVVTPSSLGYEEMTLDDLVVVDLEGNVVSGTRSATSEKGVHLAAFAAFPEVGGVVHCHAVHASMYAVSHRPIPAAIDDFVVYIGGDVPVGAYHPSGSDSLSVEVAGHLHDRSAVLMANHGLVTIGKSVDDACTRARGRAQRQDHVGRPAARRHRRTPVQGRPRLHRRLLLHPHRDLEPEDGLTCRLGALPDPSRTRAFCRESWQNPRWPSAAQSASATSRRNAFRRGAIGSRLASIVVISSRCGTASDRTGAPTRVGPGGGSVSALRSGSVHCAGVVGSTDVRGRWSGVRPIRSCSCVRSDGEVPLVGDGAVTQARRATPDGPDGR